MENVNYIETAEGSEMQIKEVKIDTRESGELKIHRIVNTVSNKESGFYNNIARVNNTTHQDEVSADAILQVTTEVETKEDGHFYTTVAVGMTKSEMVDLYKSLQYILFEDIK